MICSLPNLQYCLYLKSKIFKGSSIIVNVFPYVQNNHEGEGVSMRVCMNYEECQRWRLVKFAFYKYIFVQSKRKGVDTLYKLIT